MRDAPAIFDRLAERLLVRALVRFAVGRCRGVLAPVAALAFAVPFERVRAADPPVDEAVDLRVLPYLLEVRIAIGCPFPSQRACAGASGEIAAAGSAAYATF